MKIYNTLTKELEEFKPIKSNEISMYVCGPTVYSYIHIGNARPVIFFDVVRNYFQFLGYKVKYVSNFTDVDDKIIAQAQLEKISERELSDKYIKAFKDDVYRLNSGDWDENPRVTEYMDKIISFIDELVVKEYAYVVNGDVYFEVGKIKDYGKFSGQVSSELEEGARIDVNTNKKNPSDFTLWKKTTDGINWDSPWSKGRPGWHTECVTMVNTIFGDKIDIHGGGSGLKFPHHENEIAQSKAVNNNSIANYWMHNGLLVLGKDKMSKSLGNIISISDLLKKAPYQAFKIMMLTTQYRQPIVYSDEILDNAIKDWFKIENAYLQAALKLDLNNSLEDVNVSTLDHDLVKEFKGFMSDDFNTPNAFMVIFKLVKEINGLIRKKDIDYNNLNSNLNILGSFLKVLGIKIDYVKLDEKDRELIFKWQEFRKQKAFDKADDIRRKLTDKGIKL